MLSSNACFEQLYTFTGIQNLRRIFPGVSLQGRTPLLAFNWLHRSAYDLTSLPVPVTSSFHTAEVAFGFPERIYHPGHYIRRLSTRNPQPPKPTLNPNTLRIFWPGRDTHPQAPKP